MVVRHIPVQEVVIIPAHHTWVRADTAQAALNVTGSDGVKRTADVQEGSKAVGLRVDKSFDIIRKGRGGGLRRFVTAEAMLLRVERLEQQHRRDGHAPSWWSPEQSSPRWVATGCE